MEVAEDYMGEMPPNDTQLKGWRIEAAGRSEAKDYSG